MFADLCCLHADTYMTASHLLMTTAANDGERAMTCESWHDQPQLQERLDLYLARAQAAMGFARTATRLQAPQQGGVLEAPSDGDSGQQHQAKLGQLNANLAFIEENSGSLQLEIVQNAPPRYNQMQRVPVRTSAAYQQSCHAGLAAFSKAVQLLPDEWEFQLNLAKLLRKSGGADEQVLWHLAKACCLAKLHNKGLIEPMYQLHALRLKLLLSNSPDLDVLGRYSFTPSATAELVQVEAQSSPQAIITADARTTEGDVQAEGSDSAPSQATEQPAPAAQPAASSNRNCSLLSDAMAAMAWCLEKSKTGNHETFHKARYRQAHSMYCQGQHQEALQVLQPLFKRRGSHSFCINFYMIETQMGAKVSISDYRSLAACLHWATTFIFMACPAETVCQ